MRNDVPIAAVCRYWRSHSVKQMLPRDYAHAHKHTCSHACVRAYDIRMHARTVMQEPMHVHAHACTHSPRNHTNTQTCTCMSQGGAVSKEQRLRALLLEQVLAYMRVCLTAVRVLCRRRH